MDSRQVDTPGTGISITGTDRAGPRDRGRAQINEWERLARLWWMSDRTKIKYLDVLPFCGPWRDIWQDVKELQPLDDNPLFAQIAGLARVPADGLLRLQRGICLELEREWRWHKQPPPTIADKEARRRAGRNQLAKLKRLSSDLSGALHGLNSDALFSLGYAAVLLKLAPNGADRDDGPPEPPLPGGYDFDQIKRSIATLAERASEAVDADRRTKRPSNPVGRKARGGLGSSPFGPGFLRAFTLHLQWDIKAAGGRYLTIDKNGRSGTLPDALEILRSHLPKGFIPSILPASTLANVNMLAKKLADAGIEESNF
jgi:hypothetical protein